MTAVAVDDEVAALAALTSLLRSAGFSAHAVSSAAETLSLVERLRPDVVLMDLILPDADGLDLCRQIRQTSTVPIVAISGRTGTADVTSALEVGADLYLRKPWHPVELVARVAALLRRAQGGHRYGAAGVLRAGQLIVDLEQREVCVGDRAVSLTPVEFELLTVLVSNRGRAMRHSELLARVWGYGAGVRTRTLDVHISRLRARLGETPGRGSIATVPGVGYRFDPVSPDSETEQAA